MIVAALWRLPDTFQTTSYTVRTCLLTRGNITFPPTSTSRRQRDSQQSLDCLLQWRNMTIGLIALLLRTDKLYRLMASAFDRVITGMQG